MNIMNIALWVAQGLLAAAFLMAAKMKILSYEKYKVQAGPDVPSEESAFLIGLSELAGALGVILPWATNRYPILTPLAATGLEIVMLLALGFHYRHKHPFKNYIPALVLLALCVFVSIGRFLY